MCFIPQMLATGLFNCDICGRPIDFDWLCIHALRHDRRYAVLRT